MDDDYCSLLFEPEEHRGLSDEAFYRKLQSAVEKIGKDERLLKSAAELVEALKLQSEMIVNLISTVDSQGTKLQELKSKESVREGLENLELVELKRKQMESSELINERRIKMAKVYNYVRVVESYVRVVERERISKLSDEEFYQELTSSVEKMGVEMGDESLLKSATEVVDILKLQNEKIVNLRSTIKSEGEKLKELKSKEIDGAGLEWSGIRKPGVGLS